MHYQTLYCKTFSCIYNISLKNQIIETKQILTQYYLCNFELFGYKDQHFRIKKSSITYFVPM